MAQRVDALIRQLDFRGEELAAVERDIAIEAIDDPVVVRLMTVPGIDVTVAIAVVAAVGDFSRFDDPARLVAYLGLNRAGRPGPPRRHQSDRRRRSGRSRMITGRDRPRGSSSRPERRVGCGGDG